MEQPSNSITESQTEMSVLAKIIGVFTEPKQVFTSLERKSDFIIPLVIIMLTAFAFTFIAWPVIEKASVQSATERMEDSGLSQEQIDQQIGTIKSVGKISGLIGSVVSVLLIAIIVSGILLFCGNIILGGNSTFKKMLAVFSYASLIDFPAYILRLILVTSKETLFIYLSPAAFLSIEAKDTLLFKILAVFDIFNIWKMILIGIGIAVLYRISNKKAFGLIAILFIIFSAVSIAFSGLTGRG